MSASATTIFRHVIVPIWRAVSRRMLRCRRAAMAKPCYDQSYDVPRRTIGRGTGSLWNAAFKLQKESLASSFTNTQWKQSLFSAV